MRHARLALALPLLALAGAACDLILDIPNPDEVKDLDEVGERLCECPYLTEQGEAVVDACVSGVEAGGEDGLRLLAEADCTDCGKVSTCYGQATGAEPLPDGSSCQLAQWCGACTNHTGCESFSCCLFGLVAFGNDVGLVGQCCESCVGCSALFPATGNAPLVAENGVCLEALAPGIALMDCLCTDQAWDACADVCGPRMPGLPIDKRREQCAWYYGPCRDCLFERTGDACQDADLACKQAPSRPIGPAP